MSTSKRTMAGLLILVCMSPGLAFAQPVARLIGKVIDVEGKPLQGVTVTATSPDVPSFKEIRTTDRKGAFILDFRDVDVTYHYKLEKAGYASLEIDQKWELVGTDRHEWTMQAAAAPVAAAGGPPPASTSEPAIVAFNAGVTALKAKDFATAEMKFKEAVQHDPELTQAWAALSSAQVQTGHNLEAAAAAEKAMALGSKDEAVLLSRWQAYRNLKDEAKAAEALKDLESVGRRAEEAKRIHNEGVALVKAGDQAGAFAKFQEALTVDPSLQPAQLALATAGLKLGRNDEAVSAAEAVLKGDPGNEQAIRLRYNGALALGDKERLFEALVGLAKVDPGVASKGLMKLAFDAYDANDVVRAKAGFLKVLEIDANQPLVHYYLALAYVNQGATAEARRHLEQVVALSPNSKEAATARDMLAQLPK